MKETRPRNALAPSVATRYSLTAHDVQEFVHALKACSKRASREDRLRLIFAIFDVDNDGVVSAEDLELMVRQLAGRSLA